MFFGKFDFDLLFLSIFLKIILYKIKQNQAACGTVNFGNNVKIAGGIEATQGSWPSIAYIEWNYKANYSMPDGETYTYTAPMFPCGGTLITTRIILTAGKHKLE